MKETSICTEVPITTHRPAEPTAREREILDLIWARPSTQEIAPRMGITTKTVESHRSNLMRKFRVYNIATLVRVALLKGILRVNPSPRANKPPRRFDSPR